MTGYELCVIAKNTELLDALAKIKEHCCKTDCCDNCFFQDEDLMCVLRHNPNRWDLQEIAEHLWGGLE